MSAQTYMPGKSVDEVAANAKTTKIHKMSSNENPYGPSPDAVAAMTNALPSLGFYPANLDTGFQEKLVASHGRGFAVENIVTANGGCDVLDLVARAYLDTDSSALICPPTFPVYQVTVKKTGADIINVPLESESFALQLDAIATALQPNTKVIYICNPNNPTGTHFGQDVFDTLVDIVPDDVLIVYDEVYYHFASESLPDALAAVLAGKNIVVVHSFSKAYGLAGLRLGYGVARADIIERLESQKNPFHINTLNLLAGEAALEDAAHIAKSVESNTLWRQTMRDELRAMGLRVWDSQTNFMLFEVPTGLVAAELADKLLEHGIMVRPAFGLDNHLRVSVALPEANRYFLDTMKQLVEGA